MSAMTPWKGRIRMESPVAGLRRRQLTLTQVLAQSIAAVAPSAAMVTVPVFVLAGVGTAAVACFAAATALMLLVGYCTSQFARRMASASGLYSYTAKGLGPAAAFTGGWALMVGYLGAATASVLATALYLSSLLDLTGIGPGKASGTVGVTVVVVAVIAALLMVRGIRLSTGVSLGLEVISIALVIVVLSVLTLSHPRFTSAAPTIPSHLGLDALALGIVLAVSSFVGFESAGTLGVEAKKPLVTVPTALRWTPLALGALFLTAVTTETVIFAHAPVVMLHSAIPITDLTRARGDAWLSGMLDISVAASFFACAVGSANAFVRIVFSMGREGMFPRPVGRTHHRFGTPHVAIMALMPFLAGIPLMLVVSGVSSRDALLSLLTLSAVGYLTSYALVCLATPAFLWRIGEMTFRPLLAGIVAFITMTVLILWALAGKVSTNLPLPVTFFGIMGLGWVLLGMEWLKNPERVSRIGVYDERVADDVFVGTRIVGTK